MYINNKVVDIKGKVNISGNTLADTGATPSNVLLYTAENTCKLNVNGALDTTTPIGVGIRKANTTDTGFTLAYVCDPAGHVIGLQQPGA